MTTATATTGKATAKAKGQTKATDADAKATTATVDPSADATPTDAERLGNLYRQGRELAKARTKANSAFGKAPTDAKRAELDRLNDDWATLYASLNAIPTGTTAKGGVTLADAIGALFAPASKRELQQRCDKAFGVG